MILGIETSGKLCSIAWYENKETLLEYNIEKNHVHSTLLADLYKTGMDYLNRSAKDIRFAAVAIGPGSFTGLRIGMSFIKGLCYGFDIPLVGVSNFNVLAFQSPVNFGTFSTLIDANKGRYYFAVFDKNAEEFSEIGIIELKNLKNVLSNKLGVVLDSYIESDNIGIFCKHLNWISRGYFNASFLCKTAEKKYNKFGADNLSELEPLYLQAFAGIL